MQYYYLPGRILEGMDRVNRNFLWDTTESVKKTHWVGWHKVVKPKKKGGLRLQAARGKKHFPSLEVELEISCRKGIPLGACFKGEVMF